MLPHTQSLSEMMSNPQALSDFDLVFNDQDLNVFLDGIAQGGDAALGALDTAGPLPLQLLPPDEPLMVPQPTGMLQQPPSSVQSSYEDLPQHIAPPPPPTGSTTTSGSSNDQLKATLGNLLAPGAASSAGAGPLDLRALQTLLGTTLAPPPPSTAVSTGLLRPQQTPAPQPSTTISRGLKAVAADTKHQVSHSTVEKQRRDRINALIDELRDLVPPSKATQAAAAAGGAKDSNSEGRRPKHVVLADTISLLKQLQTRGSLANLLAAAGSMGPGSAQLPSAEALQAHMRAPFGELGAQSMPIKEERHSPTNSNSKGSVSSHEDVEMRDETRTTAAPKLPHIPIQPTLLAGVVVERGPDCMYVQVRCRDRKGLLLDIINALRNMPLEIRTAAVTTQPDGQVRDVFEVCVDDKALQPEDVQNMVHEALFQQYHLSGEAHKRARC